MDWLIYVVIAGMLAGGWLVWRRWRRPAEEQGTSVAGVPARLAGMYEWGINPGSDGTSVMYTLRTCRHCVHLKNFLDKQGIACHLVYVDEFNGTARTEMMGKVRFHNPRGSFPTLVLPDGKVVVGFREHEVRAAFGLPDSE